MAHVFEWFVARLPYEGLLLMSLVYLTFDFYPQVSSFTAIWRTPAFWMLWVVFSFLDLLAFAILYERSLQNIQAMIRSHVLAIAALALVATIGVYSILQSFTFQFAGRKVIDVEEVITRFRASSLQSSVAKRASLSRQSARRLAEGLRAAYQPHLEALPADYFQIMTLARMARDRIAADLDRFQNSEGSEREALLNELVMRMAVADPENVREIIRKRRA